MKWFGWIRPALNWRVGLLTLGLVFVIEYGLTNRYWYHSWDDRYWRTDRWTGHVQKFYVSGWVTQD